MSFAPDFRWLSVTDIDNFIQFPDISLDFELTVDYGQTNPLWDCLSCKSNDYAIMCYVPMDMFFNMDTMTWKYALREQCPDEHICIFDVSLNLMGSSSSETPTETAEIPVDMGPGRNTVINGKKLLNYLMRNRSATFVHYMQARNFYDRSFMINALDDRHPTLYAVYIDKDTGLTIPHTLKRTRCVVLNKPAKEPLHVWQTNDECKSSCYYAGHPESLQGNHEHMDYEFQEYYYADLEAIIPQNQRYPRFACPVTFDPSLNHGTFTHYDADPQRSLLLYHIDASQRIIVAYASYDQVPRSDNGEACFIADPILQASIWYPEDDNFGKCPRLHMPISMVFASELAVDASGECTITSPEYPIPFRYDMANIQRHNIGERIIQLASVYLFDGCKPEHMANFPRMATDTKTLTDTIVAGLSIHLSRSTELRTAIIESIYKAKGIHPFSSYALSNGIINCGNMSDILMNINDVMYMIIRITIKFDVDSNLPESMAFVIHNTPIILCLVPPKSGSG